VKSLVLLGVVALLAGCSTIESEYRQPWTVYKTRADIVPFALHGNQSKAR
jgi:uncharacterized protein YceK